jgi:hypothetical protein
MQQQTSVTSILLLCCLLCYSSGHRRYILNENGAIVPADTAEVEEAARDLYLHALVAGSAAMEYPWIAENEGLQLILDEEQARKLGYGGYRLRRGGLRGGLRWY